MNKVTLIVCAGDCSSVQTYPIETGRPLPEIHSFYNEDYGLPPGFTLIAVVEGWPDLKVRDDARTAEWGVL